MRPLEVREATKLYGDERTPVVAVRNASLSLEEGVFAALVGRSGCGKSTLLNLCGAMDFPTSGSVWIDGADTGRLSDQELARLRREKIGFIFQSFQLMPTLTAGENVELPLLLARRRDARKVAAERLRWVDLQGLENRYPHRLSGGQQQRVAIARALAANPRLLLADEPTGNLDTATGEVVLDLLTRSAREFGVAILMATHSAESTAAADLIVRMSDGEIVPLEDFQNVQRTA